MERKLRGKMMMVALLVAECGPELFLMIVGDWR